MSRFPLRLVLLASVLAAPGLPEVLASDGVLEINQACALNGGCFPGDSPGFPVTITSSAPGHSFRLTGDLGPLGQNQTAISISINGVTVDLGGFRIYGLTQCTVVPVTCAPLGSGIGVAGGSDVTVMNGTVQGMGDDGVQIVYSSHAENLHLLQNGGDGLSLGNESLAIGNVITSNGGDGIRCGSHCGIHQNTMVGNKFHGIELISGTVTGNTSSGNGARGGQFGTQTLFANNTFAGNSVPDRSGGHGAGGNFCGDHSCSTHGERRYYKGINSVNGANALSACAAGFHMASIFELLDTSTLLYDTTLGDFKDDSGQGPPNYAIGWVRTGSVKSTFIGPGSGNCDAWTSSYGTDNGTTLRLDAYNWEAGSLNMVPWIPGIADCSTSLAVWCVED